jgi:[acyl-carrier-protein] S-malonyltransferase
LNATNISQPAIYVASLAALEHLKATEPDTLTAVTATAGLSLGEYTALTFAGSISFRDGLHLVQIRGEAMQAAAEATPGGMVSIIGPELTEVETMVQEAKSAGKVDIANILAPGNTVVSGSDAAMNVICRLADAKGLRTVRLAVAGAFHTELMKPADETLAKALDTVTLRQASLPVWSNVDAQPHTAPEQFRDLLVRQLVSPVRWEETMRKLLSTGIERFLEVGPGRVLAGLLKRIHRKADIRNVSA